jgi:hypothetical protein
MLPCDLSPSLGSPTGNTDGPATAGVSADLKVCNC